MTSRKTDWKRPAQVLSVLAGVGLCAVLAGGCAEEPPPPPPKPAVAPPPPPPPDPMENVKLHEKVQFPEEIVPSSPQVAEAIAALANAFASGDDEALRSVIVEADHGILDALIAGGMWGENTGSIEAVRVCALDEGGDGANVGIGIQDDHGAYLLGWRTDASQDYQWRSLDIELQKASRVSELDDASLLPRPVAEAKQFLVVVEEKEDKDKRNSGSGGTSADPGGAPDREPGFKKPRRRFR